MSDRQDEPGTGDDALWGWEKRTDPEPTDPEPTAPYGTSDASPTQSAYRPPEQGTYQQPYPSPAQPEYQPGYQQPSPQPYRPSYQPPPPPGGYGAPVPYSPPGAWPGYGFTPPPNDGLGIAALVVGIASLVLACGYGVGLLGSPVALFMGRASMRRIDRSQGQLGGRGQAQAGFILGIVGTVLLVLLVVVVAVVVFAVFQTGSTTTGTTTGTGNV